MVLVVNNRRVVSGDKMAGIRRPRRKASNERQRPVARTAAPFIAAFA